MTLDNIYWHALPHTLARPSSISVSLHWICPQWCYTFRSVCVAANEKKTLRSTSGIDISGDYKNASVSVGTRLESWLIAKWFCQTDGADLWAQFVQRDQTKTELQTKSWIRCCYCCSCCRSTCSFTVCIFKITRRAIQTHARTLFVFVLTEPNRAK